MESSEMYSFNFILPQTAFKIWGVSDHEPKIFNQFEYLDRAPNDSKLIQPIYEINELIALEYGVQAVKHISKDQNVKFESTIFDQQILNLRHHYPNFTTTGSIEILDYSNVTYWLIGLRDIKFGEDFFRACKRCYLLRKRSEPDKIKSLYTLAYPWQIDFIKPFNVLWDTKLLEFERIKKSSTSFIKRNIDLFPELRFLKESKSKLIICPRAYSSLDEFHEWVIINEHKIKKFDSSSVFIKQHRTTSEQYPNEFSVLGINFVTFNSPLSRVLPLEIVLMDDPEINVITAPSSIMAKLDNVLVLKPDLLDIKFYGLLFKRMEETKIQFYF